MFDQKISLSAVKTLNRPRIFFCNLYLGLLSYIVSLNIATVYAAYQYSISTISTKPSHHVWSLNLIISSEINYNSHKQIVQMTIQISVLAKHPINDVLMLVKNEHWMLTYFMMFIYLFISYLLDFFIVGIRMYCLQFQTVTSCLFITRRIVFVRWCITICDLSFD